MAQASAENLKHTGPAEKERVATEKALSKYAGAAFSKEKEQSRQSKAQNHEGGESQGGLRPHLGEKKEDQSGSKKRKKGPHTEGRQFPRKKGRAGKHEEPP